MNFWQKKLLHTDTHFSTFGTNNEEGSGLGLLLCKDFVVKNIRSGREEQAMMTTLAGLIVVLMMVIQQIDVLFQSIKSIFGL